MIDDDDEEELINKTALIGVAVLSPMLLNKITDKRIPRAVALALHIPLDLVSVLSLLIP